MELLVSASVTPLLFGATFPLHSQRTELDELFQHGINVALVIHMQSKHKCSSDEFDGGCHPIWSLAT